MNLRSLLKRATSEEAFKATPKQTEFIETVLSGQYLYMAMGGGIRGTKTWAVLAAVVLLCRIYPGSRWAIVRKDLPTLRRNTIPSFLKLRDLCQGFVGDINQATWSASCANGSEIIFFPESFEQDPNLERWRGLEVNGFILEEANELQEASAVKAIERAGSWIIPRRPNAPEPKQPDPIILFTFNPCDNWPRQWFYEPHAAGTLRAPYYYLPATQIDNPYIPEVVREAWKNMPEAEYKRFVEGDWSSITDPDQLIHTEWIWNAKNVEHILGPNRLGCDIARYGDDNTVFSRINGNMLLGFEEHEHLPTNRTAELISIAARNPYSPVNADNIVVDASGLGSGVVDQLRSTHKLFIREFVGGSHMITRRIKERTPAGPGGRPPREPGDKTLSTFKFKNKRAQGYWELAEKLRLGKVAISPNIDSDHFNRLVADLTAIKYRIDNEMTVVLEKKEDLKLRIGRSPDWGDAWMMGEFDFTDPVAPRRRRRGQTMSIRG